jgi:chromosomal replication initiation ATPase DnaA
VRTQRDAESIWTSVCKKSLSKEVSPLTYNTWFLSAKPYLSGERVFGLAVPSDIAKEYVGQHRPLIENALKDYTRVNYSLEITVRPDGTVPSQEERFSAFEKNGNGNGNFRAGQLNPNYSFSSFIVGPGTVSWRMARRNPSIATNVNESRSQIKFNPVRAERL